MFRVALHPSALHLHDLFEGLLNINNPHAAEKNKDQLEGVQRRAAKLISAIKDEDAM